MNQTFVEPDDRWHRILSALRRYELDLMAPFAATTDEPSFHPDGCELCSPSKGNDVYVAEDTEGRLFRVCHECLYMIEYGE